MRMGFRVLIYLSACCLPAVVLYAIVVTRSTHTHRQGTYTPQLAQQLAIGMSRAQVEEVLGGTPGCRATRRTFILNLNTEPRKLYIWWEDDSSAIGVMFDSENRVRFIRVEGRYTSEDFSSDGEKPNPTWLGRLLQD